MKTLRRRPRKQRLLAGIAAAGLVFLLAACGSGASGGSNSNGSSPAPVSGY